MFAQAPKIILQLSQKHVNGCLDVGPGECREILLESRRGKAASLQRSAFSFWRATINQLAKAA
jgi:hypothetical protein